jgi:predicted DCC family thiol-disulfide oxidoreductase YuxK
MTPELYQACGQAVHVLAVDGRILKAGRASLFVLVELGYPRWLVRPFAWLPLVWLTELGYWLVANNRPFFSKFLFTGDNREIGD